MGDRSTQAKRLCVAYLATHHAVLVDGEHLAPLAEVHLQLEHGRHGWHGALRDHASEDGPRGPHLTRTDTTRLERHAGPKEWSPCAKRALPSVRTV